MSVSQSHSTFSGPVVLDQHYQLISSERLSEIARQYDWIVGPIHRASETVRGMPFFEFIQHMQSPRDFKACACQLYYHSATFPKVMGLMLGLTPMHENHMMPFYSAHASGESTHHQLLLKWMLKQGLLQSSDEIRAVITTPETNACVNLAYQMAVEQDRDKWLVALNCGIERCSNDFFKVVAPTMQRLGAGDEYFDIHVEADEHHSIMGLEYIHADLSPERQRMLIAKSLEGITLWAAMLHSWIGMTAVPVFDLEGCLVHRPVWQCH
ncbi:pyrroloquinoline quinone (PQQ) biosynthesis protein C [Chitinivorax tropicus]|uniref:Pyrroloquinoline quinone (PQQ) biosynthesis protein C n=1 Tax=Chitinivorax tropicus TaxID=714531 RepID=A0A840MHL8_9PROT|nr:iron-containing redox enzyme family protein [Chitinivorax tropicus]MBB5018704.1 pyrroloquinoline quinone (PQQ) biosynthesis protein C [Chitinivorax tropicus]